jgi:hypothetical protein
MGRRGISASGGEIRARASDEGRPLTQWEAQQARHYDRARFRSWFGNLREIRAKCGNC